MLMHQENHLSFFAKLASVGRWLFWLSIVYTIFWVWKTLIISAFYPMNPQARSTAWGQFKWYCPSYLEFFCHIVPLYFLYLFQAQLRKGIALGEEELIGKGLNNLWRFFISLTVIVVARSIFEILIQPNW